MATWSYDFGSVNAEDLAELSPTDFSKGVETARDAAVTLIESGAVGEADSYRVVVRADGGAPSGLLLEVRPNVQPAAVHTPVPVAGPIPAPTPEPRPAPVERVDEDQNEEEE